MMPRPHQETNENHALGFSIYCRGLIYQALAQAIHPWV
jgi:hypothetical protein